MNEKAQIARIAKTNVINKAGFGPGTEALAEKASTKAIEII